MKRSSGIAASALLACSFAAGIVAAPAMARVSAHHSSSSYHGKSITFSYPNGWKMLSPSQDATFGQEVVGPTKGLSVGEAVGITKAQGKGGAAFVVLKALMDSKLQSEIKGHHSQFMAGVVSGVAGSKGTTIIRKGATTLSGQPAQGIEAVQGSNHEVFSVAIAGDEKSLYMALYLTNPASLWNSYKSTFGGIDGSIRFK